MRILFTEQDPIIADLYKAKLAALGLEVVHAFDQQSAQQAFETQPFSLALISIYVRHGAENSEGLQLLGKIRRHYYSPISVVILADYPENSQLHKALEMAANAYIIKAEHSPDQIINQIKAHLT